MKIAIVGAWTQIMYEESIAKNFKLLGHEVIKFSTKAYFESLVSKIEQKFIFKGYYTYKLNNDIFKFLKVNNPDIILFWRPTNIMPSLLKKLKNLGIKKLVSYNHDDFSGPSLGAPVPYHHYRLWKLYLKCAPLFDAHFVKRTSNIEHLKKLGAKNIYLGKMWFDPQIHHPVTLKAEEEALFKTDVVFVGHYEPDGREKYIDALIKNGIKIKIWGGKYWNKKALKENYLKLSPITKAEGQDYSKALSGAKICLAFLSKINRDSYTRRCFEIPACGKVMLAERTDQLVKMFKEDKEACFFSSIDELIFKTKWLLKNNDIREQIAVAGLKKVWSDGCDAKSRSKEFLEKILK